MKLNNILYVLFFVISNTVSAEDVMDPLKHYAKGLYKESVITYVSVDLDKNGYKDILIMNHEASGSNQRGLNYWSLYMNTGNGYTRIQEQISMMNFEAHFIDDLNTNGLITYIPGGGKRRTKIIYYVDSDNGLKSKELHVESVKDGESLVEVVNEVSIGERVDTEVNQNVSVDKVLAPSIYSRLMSRNDNPFERYFFHRDPDRPGTDWHIAIDKETSKEVGYFNVFTEKFVPFDDTDSKKKINKIEQYSKKPESFDGLPEIDGKDVVNNDKQDLSDAEDSYVRYIVLAVLVLLLSLFVINLRRNR